MINKWDDWPSDGEECATCPQCGRRPRGFAFAPETGYLRCAVGHVWHPDTREEETA